MSKTDRTSVRLHEDVPLFKQAVNFTAVRTGFTPLLIEKDYFCTVLLAYLSENPGGLVFKGGTCLAKVLTGFYRLSEDLGFVIPLPVDAGRKKRSESVEPLKAVLSRLTADHPVFEQSDPLAGANQSTQYIGAVHFRSPVSGQAEKISIDISLREPLIDQVQKGSAKTILLNPVTNKPIVPGVYFPCISTVEAFAEKVRAALTRREAAIRDFYDIDYAFRLSGLDLEAPGFKALIEAKLAVPGNDPVKLGSEKLNDLRTQLAGRLKPVLRPDDYQAFDLDRAFGLVEAMAKSVELRPIFPG